MTKWLETYYMGLNSIIPTGEAHCSYTTKALAGGPVEHFNLKEDSLMSSWLYICRSKAACSVVLSGGSGGGDPVFRTVILRGGSISCPRSKLLLATPQPKLCTICTSRDLLSQLGLLAQLLFGFGRIPKQ